MAVDVDGAGLDVVEARDEADDGGFSAAGRADDAYELAGLDLEVEIGEDWVVGVVAEGDVVEFDLAVAGFRARGRRGSRG